MTWLSIIDRELMRGDAREDFQISGLSNKTVVSLIEMGCTGGEASLVGGPGPCQLCSKDSYVLTHIQTCNLY